MIGRRSAEDALKPTMYQICVQGRLTERLASALEGMTLHGGAVNTVFTGEVKDQAQLYGLLDRLRDLGLELISVQPQTEPDQSEAATVQSSSAMAGSVQASPLSTTSVAPASR
jgi:hypothetical protein